MLVKKIDVLKQARDSSLNSSHDDCQLKSLLGAGEVGGGGSIQNKNGVRCGGGRGVLKKRTKTKKGEGCYAYLYVRYVKKTA